MHQKIRLERTINFELVKVLTIKPLTKQTRESKNTLRKPKQIESHNHELKIQQNHCTKLTLQTSCKPTTGALIQWD